MPSIYINVWHDNLLLRSESHNLFFHHQVAVSKCSATGRDMSMLLEARDQMSTSLTDIAHLTERTCALVYYITSHGTIQQVVSMEARLFFSLRRVVMTLHKAWKFWILYFLSNSSLLIIYGHFRYDHHNCMMEFWISIYNHTNRQIYQLLSCWLHMLDQFICKLLHAGMFALLYIPILQICFYRQEVIIIFYSITANMFTCNGYILVLHKLTIHILTQILSFWLFGRWCFPWWYIHVDIYLNMYGLRGKHSWRHRPKAKSLCMYFAYIYMIIYMYIYVKWLGQSAKN